MSTALIEPVVASQDTLPVCLCPWRENPHRLVTWLDVHNFAGEHFQLAIRILERIRCEWGHAQPAGDAFAARTLGQRTMVSQSQRQSLAVELEEVQNQVTHSGLPVSARTLSQLRAQLMAHDNPGYANLTAERFVAAIDNVQQTISNEMASMMFLYLHPHSALLYGNPLENWGPVLKRWRQTALDIGECSRCLALDRFAAAVFHILLVAEFGVIQVAYLLNVSGDRPGWGSVARLERILAKPYNERSPLEQQHSKLLENTVPEMVTLRSDRHVLMHVDNKGEWLAREIGPNTANDAIAAARKFLCRLAAELPL